MKNPGRKCFGGFIAIALVYIIISALGLRIAPNPANPQGREERRAWIATSKSWITRQTCSWLGLCGITHLRSSGWTWHDVQDHLPIPVPDVGDWWRSGTEDPLQWSDEEKAAREIPQYVFDYAPYVHLFSGEQFWPCDIAEHLVHISPYVNYSKILDLDDDRNLTNLNELNDYDGGVHGRYIYLNSNDNVEERPDWLGGRKNIPTAPELDDGEETAWPEDGDEPTGSQNDQVSFGDAPHFKAKTSEDEEDNPPPLVATPNGRCGGNSGFTCKGSKFGKCCSIYGWCGRGDSYCGDSCDPVAGQCNNPFIPSPRPHMELRRRALDLESSKPQPKPKHKQVGYSAAPALLIVVPKKDGIVDAFWFFFYSFNLGQKVIFRFGNHVGDWEHTCIRFKNGKPESVFLSEHSFGDAYAWHALEKYTPNPDGSGTMIGTWTNATAAGNAKRPVVYSAVGTHAMYATPGLHPYILPYGILHDQTDRGPIWDPSLNVRAYTWDIDTQTVRASTHNPKAPTEWFHFAGHWGDKYYPLSDKRQYCFASQCRSVNGPTGPKFKNLGRKYVCQHDRGCRVRHWADSRGARRLPREELEEAGGLPGGNSSTGWKY